MTASSLTPASHRGPALLSCLVAVGMFVLAWTWFLYVINTPSTGGRFTDAVVFRPLAAMSLIQLAASFHCLRMSVKAHQHHQMGVGLMVASMGLASVLGLLGLVGVPLFLFLQAGGASLAFKG